MKYTILVSNGSFGNLRAAANAEHKIDWWDDGQVADQTTCTVAWAATDLAGYLKGDVSTTIAVLNSNNSLVPLNTTLDKIAADPMSYAARLVKIDDLETIVKFGFSQGYPYETEFIYQNGITMNVDWEYMYENMSVTGVIEFGVMGHGLTIFPITVKNTTKTFDGTCRRIKDIKMLKSGSEFTYTGEATTTFTDYENGILIQDYTGGILLKNSKLGDNGVSEIKSGMIISNIKGKYIPASGDLIACIEISDTDLRMQVLFVKQQMQM